MELLLAGRGGGYDDRRVYKLDLLERDYTECINRLEKYLEYKRIRSGEAFDAAKEDYKNVSRDRIVSETMPKAWKDLLEKQDSLLIDLLAEKVADMCGYMPNPDQCSRFFSQICCRKGKDIDLKEDCRKPLSQVNVSMPSVSNSKIGFEYKGHYYSAGSAREVMQKIFRSYPKTSIFS